jgi:hypothetical protein
MRRIMRKTVKRANPQLLCRHAKQIFDAPPHFCGSFVRECHREQMLRRYADDSNEPRDSVNEYTRFAASGTSQNEGRNFLGSYGRTLGVVERLDDVSDIHRFVEYLKQ